MLSLAMRFAVHLRSHPHLQAPPGKGASMKIAISYKHVTLPQPLESALKNHIQKINAFLKSYAPDLVHLHGTLERNPHRVEFSFSANLSLPTGT